MTRTRSGLFEHSEGIIVTMLLETDRLMLREWTADDAEAAFAISGDPEVTRYLGESGDPHPDVDYTRASLERTAARYPTWNGRGNWAAIEKSTGEVIGGGGLLELDGGPEVEVFYHFRRDRWGKGYATELTKALIAYAFERLNLPRVVGVAYPANIASHQVMLKPGMTHEGRRRSYEQNLEYFVIARPNADESLNG
jgi:RimJ/RimL family protein N-acetyltransferase